MSSPSFKLWSGDHSQGFKSEASAGTYAERQTDCVTSRVLNQSDSDQCVSVREIIYF